MITKYGEVTISKDDNGEDSIFITNFTFDGSDVKGYAQDALKIAALKWAQQVIDENLQNCREDSTNEMLYRRQLYKLVEDKGA